MDGKRIRIALIGLGWVGTHRHVNAIRHNRRFELVGVIDRHGDRARDCAKKLGLAHWAEAKSLSEVPWLAEVEAISIATPPHAHCELVLEALDRGLHVITEKPFAMTVAQGQSMLERSRAKQKTLAVVHNFQFARSALKLQHDLQAGALGRIRRVHAVQLSNPGRRLPTWYETLPMGLFFDESPHLLYLMRRFSPGPLTLKHAHLVADPDGHETPDVILAAYESAGPQGPVPVTLDMHFSAPLSEWQFCVIGDTAMGVVDVFRDIYLRLPNDGLHTTGTVIRSSLIATAQHWGQHFSSGLMHLAGTLDYGNNEVFSRYAQAIQSASPPPNIDCADALAVLSMQHELIACRNNRA